MIEDAWERYGALVAQGHAQELLEASRDLMDQGHPEANVMHAVALVLLGEVETARAFAASLDVTREGTWPTLIEAMADLHSGRNFPSEKFPAKAAWASFLMDRRV